MAFKTKQVKTKTLGEYLTALREHLGISIKELSKVAKIPPKYLVCLEQGEYEKLPPNVYVKGFLKTLAQIFRVDEHQLLSLFEAEKSLSDHLSQTLSPPEKNMPRFVFNPRTLATAAIVLVGLTSLAYLYFQINSVRKSPVLEVFSPLEDGVADTSYLAVSGRTEPGANVYLNNQPIMTDADGNFRENLSMAPGTNLLTIKAVNKFENETVVTRKVVIPEKEIAGAKDPDVDQTQFPAPPPTEITELVDLNIQIGPQTAWVSIEADSQDIFTGTMLPGSSRTVKGDFVRVSTSNAGAVRVILNGKDLGVLGKDGETLRDVEFSK